MRKTLAIGTLTLLLWGAAASYPAAKASAPAVAPSAVTITTGSGGSIKTKLSEDIVVDEGSTLNREWITIHQATLPIDIAGTAGATTVYRGSRDGYAYSAAFDLQVKEPISAVEIRFICFDVWGSHMVTLVETEVQDMSAGKTSLKSQWNLFSENDCSVYYASIAYVARVRTKAGRVIEADTAPVIEAARKFSAKFKPEDLEPPQAKH